MGARQELEVKESNVGFLIFDGVYFTDVAATRIIFEEANYILSKSDIKPFYHIFSLGEKSKYRVYSSTIEETHKLDSSVARDIDLLIIPGGKMENVTDSQTVKDYIADIYPKLRTLSSVCGGAVALAHFGYLDGKHAATHPLGRYEEIEEKYGDKNIKLVKEPVVRDGKIITSGGVFKGVDLALQIVREDLGEDVAKQVVNEVRYFGEEKF